MVTRRRYRSPSKRSPAKEFGAKHRPERGRKQHASHIPDAPKRWTHLRTMKAVRDRGNRACEQPGSATSESQTSRRQPFDSPEYRDEAGNSEQKNVERT